MLDALHRLKVPPVAAAVLAAALVASTSWALVAQSRSSSAATERDAVAAELAQLKESAGQLAQVEARLGSARMEYAKVVQMWSDARTRLGAAQQELTALTKRADQAREKVSQTGSIRPSEPPKPPAPKR